MSVLTAEEKKEYSLGFKATKKQKDDLQKWSTLIHSVQDSGGVEWDGDVLLLVVPSQGIEGIERTLLNTAYGLSENVRTNVTINNLNFVNLSSIFVTIF
jgi:hypothetical protein